MSVCVRTGVCVCMCLCVTVRVKTGCVFEQKGWGVCLKGCVHVR